MVVKGIDVSNWQGNIDWSKVAADGYQFAFIKASEGVSYKDPYFRYNWLAAKNAGLYVGAYHFPEPFKNADARDEADFFFDAVLSRVTLEEGDMLALDMEVTEAANYGSYGDWALYWLQCTQSYFNFPPLLYTARNYINVLSLNNPELANYGLWLAQWILTNSLVVPPAPAPWNLIAFWQYTEKGSVNGIQGNVDLDVFNGTIDRLPLYGKPKQEEPPPPNVIDTEAIEAQLKTMESSISTIRGLLHPS